MRISDAEIFRRINSYHQNFFKFIRSSKHTHTLAKREEEKERELAEDELLSLAKAKRGERESERGAE